MGDIQLLAISLSPRDIAKLRRMQAATEAGLVNGYYLQLMSSRGDREPESGVSAMSRGLKLMAKELMFPMLVLSQLSRAPETRGGTIDRSSAISANREVSSRTPTWWALSFAKKFTSATGKIARVGGVDHCPSKRNGPIGTVNLVYLHALTKFENRARSWERFPNIKGKLYMSSDTCSWN